MTRKHSKKKSHSRKKSSVSISKPTPKPITEIDRIIDRRTEPDPKYDGKITESFRLRWKGCEAADDTWLARKQLLEVAPGVADDELKRCEALLRDFEEMLKLRGVAEGEGKGSMVRFCEVVRLKKVNAAGNSIEVEQELKG